MSFGLTLVDKILVFVRKKLVFEVAVKRRPNQPRESDGPMTARKNIFGKESDQKSTNISIIKVWFGPTPVDEIVFLIVLG